MREYVEKIEGKKNTVTLYDLRTCFVYGGGVMPGWQAGFGVGKYNSPKQNSKRFNCQVRQNICPSGLLIYGMVL